jgi:hypothetical protein
MHSEGGVPSCKKKAKSDLLLELLRLFFINKDPFIVLELNDAESFKHSVKQVVDNFFVQFAAG